MLQDTDAIAAAGYGRLVAWVLRSFYRAWRRLYRSWMVRQCWRPTSTVDLFFPDVALVFRCLPRLDTLLSPPPQSKVCSVLRFTFSFSFLDFVLGLVSPVYTGSTVDDRVERMFRRQWNTHAYGWIPRRSGLKRSCQSEISGQAGVPSGFRKGDPETPTSLLDLPLVNRNNRVSKILDVRPRGRCHAHPPWSVLV